MHIHLDNFAEKLPNDEFLSGFGKPTSGAPIPEPLVRSQNRKN